MIKIAICDDERCFVDQIRNILKAYCKEVGQTIFAIRAGDRGISCESGELFDEAC